MRRSFLEQLNELFKHNRLVLVNKLPEHIVIYGCIYYKILLIKKKGGKTLGTTNEIEKFYSKKSLGLKQIIFSSLKNRKLPSDQIILYIFERAKEFLQKDNNNWIVFDFDFDNSLIKTKDFLINYNFYNEDIQMFKEF